VYCRNLVLRKPAGLELLQNASCHPLAPVRRCVMRVGEEQRSRIAKQGQIDAQNIVCLANTFVDSTNPYSCIRRGNMLGKH
jgi:hypothetical protein